jgi:hypothetical protein
MLREILSSIARRADWSAVPLAMRTARLGVAGFTEGGGPTANPPARWPRRCVFSKMLQSADAVAPSQRNLCSCFGTAQSHLRLAICGFNLADRGWVHFINSQFSNPAAAERKCLRLFAEAF